MIKKKIKLGSREYQQNVAKQKFLNKQGIKVKIDGSWGPWQQKQYDANYDGITKVLPFVGIQK